MSTAEEQTGQKVIRESYPLSFELLKSGEPAEDYVQMKRELDGWGDMEQSAFWHGRVCPSLTTIEGLIIRRVSFFSGLTSGSLTMVP